MRNIGTIRIGIRQDLYKTDINYVTAEKIDFFSLTLLAIIRHADMYKNTSFADVLLSIDVPRDLHNIFVDRLNEMIKENPPLVESRISNCSLDLNVATYSLTEKGEQTYLSQELFSQEKSYSMELIFDALQKTIKRENESIVISENESENLIVITPNSIEEKEIQKIFYNIIKKDIGKYIPYSTDKTEITKVEIVSLFEKIIQDKIGISYNNDERLEFFNENPEVTRLFVNYISSAKNELKDKKIFGYYENIPLQTVNLSNAKLVEWNRHNKLEMKVVWGEGKVLSLLDNRVFSTSQKISLKKCEECTFAGITVTNKYVVYKYTLYDKNGIAIPLEEVDNSEESYSNVFSMVWEHNKSFKDSFIEFSVLAAPSSKKGELINHIAEENNYSNDIVNKLLSLDEESTIKELNLIKKYNELIEKEKVNTIHHKCDLYNKYLLFENQYGKLKLLCSDNFSAYKNENWNALRNNLDSFKSLFDDIGGDLEKTFSKKIKDFVSGVEDTYYFSAPEPNYDTTLNENKNWQKELKKSINSQKNPNYVALAAILRSHYEEKLNQLDKKPNLNLRGREKFYSIIKDEKIAREFYINWRNLSVLIHNTDKSHFLIRGNQNDRRKALNNALNFYTKELEPLK